MRRIDPVFDAQVATDDAVDVATQADPYVLVPAVCSHPQWTVDEAAYRNRVRFSMVSTAGAVKANFRTTGKAHTRARAAAAPITAIADRLTPTMRRQFLAAMVQGKGRINILALATAFESGSKVRVAAVLEAANLASDLTPILRTVDKVFAAAATWTASNVAETLGVPYGFDLTNPQAVAHLERYHFRLIREIDQGTREGIRRILLDSFTEGIPPLKAARRIRELVGLTERQAAAVVRYEQALIADGLAKRAAAAKAAKYSEKLLKWRAELIARTETIRSSSEGAQSAWQDAARRGVLDRETTKRVWLVADDDRLCLTICAPMADQEVGLDEPFTTGDGQQVMTPPAHPACRCSTGISRV